MQEIPALKDLVPPGKTEPGTSPIGDSVSGQLFKFESAGGLEADGKHCFQTVHDVLALRDVVTALEN